MRWCITEYFDTHFTQPNTAKLVPADVNEPAWNRRIPGGVIYARPGERLYIHVLNGDTSECHSFHLHGLRYGIESDGAWPFGVATKSGRRSDEIRPGEQWTYVFDATEETIGAWPFHNHVRNVAANVNLGLFGALIVRDPAAPRPDHEIPLFVHQVQGLALTETFQSPSLATTVCTRTLSRLREPSRTTARSTARRCRAPWWSTRLPRPATARSASATTPSTRLGVGAARLTRSPGPHRQLRPHRLAPGGGAPTYCLNGRAYVGNTPTIEVAPGERLRWYSAISTSARPGTTSIRIRPLAAADTHRRRTDVHALSPAQTSSWTPGAARGALPCALEALQCDPPEKGCRVPVKGEFLFHCHLEEHMMAGLAGLVRSKDAIRVSAEALKSVDMLLPYDDGRNTVGWVDLTRCGHICPTGKHPHEPEHDPHDHPAEPPHEHDDAPAPHDHERRSRSRRGRHTAGRDSGGHEARDDDAWGDDARHGA